MHEICVCFSCTLLDSKGDPVNKKSGFAYQPGGRPEYTITAAGLLAMQV